jgi:serine/threonine protein kinase
MQSILRHPNIALLMGCSPTIPNIVIVYELVDNSLFNVLHMKRNIEITLPMRVKIALDCARVYLYMHNLGIVHRDIKSQNVLIDNNFMVKVCDFGLARFKVRSPIRF